MWHNSGHERALSQATNEKVFARRSSARKEMMPAQPDYILLADIARLAEEEAQKHAAAISWLARLPAQSSVVWLPRPCAVENAVALDDHLPATLRAMLGRANSPLSQRLADRLSDRAGLAIGQAALGKGQAPHGRSLVLYHTPMGQPRLRARAGESGSARHLHISFTHDADAHITLLARAPGLRGLGIDVVYLSRLRNERDYLLRFARRFMVAEAWEELARSAATDAPEVRREVAARFSLMEAASKALGTGLRLGCGLGHPGSMAPRSLGVAALEQPVHYTLAPEAMGRMARLGARRMEGYWGSDDEYLVSAALLWDR